MRTEEWLAKLSEKSSNIETLEQFRARLPLGVDESGNIILSRIRAYPYGIRHTCVTGAHATAFIKRFILSLSCLYDKDELNFLVLSPKMEYGELLRLNSLEITVPFLRTKGDLESAKACITELTMLADTQKCPKLFVVLDGLEELDGCNKNGDLEEYREIFDKIARQPNIDVITGAELMKSIFSGYPGAFVGIGNCLITAEQDGKADVTYVQDDVSLSLPMTVEFPTEPSLSQTAALLNSIAKRDKT